MPVSGIHAHVPRTRVLFVDPDADALFGYQSIATGEGFDVELARDGHEAMALAHILVPSVIVLETQLLPLDGFEIIRKLKTSPRTAHIPIIIVSSAAGEAFDARVAASGCSACLTKPCAIRGLLRLVSILARGRDAGAEARHEGPVGARVAGSTAARLRRAAS